MDAQKLECQTKPPVILANSQTGAAFVPDCGRYACPYCGRKKARKLAYSIAEYFEGCSIRLMTLTATNRYNSLLPSPLPTLAWRELLKNLRNRKSWKKLKGFQYVKFVELQKNGNPHYHLLIDRFIPWKTMQSLWQDACALVLERYGIGFSTAEKLGNAKLDGDTNSKGVIKYVIKYVTKNIDEEVGRAYGQKRNRPYSTSRGIALSPKKLPSVGWRMFTIRQLGRGVGLYLSNHCLLPKLSQDETWFLGLHESAYSILMGEDFDYG